MGKVSTWVILAGCFVMLAGLCFVPAAFGQHPDSTMLASGVGIFGVGALTSASGIYLKAQALKANTSLPGTAKPQPKRARGGCEICGTETPVIHCRVHNLHLCGTCLGSHYDFRSCAYVPSTRRPAPAKPATRSAK